MRLRVVIDVPDELVPWTARQLGVSHARARQLVEEAVAGQAQLIYKSAEVLEGEPRVLVFVSNFSAAPREGGAWFECGRNAGRIMKQGRAQDEER